MTEVNKVPSVVDILMCRSGLQLVDVSAPYHIGVSISCKVILKISVCPSTQYSISESSCILVIDSWDISESE